MFERLWEGNTLTFFESGSIKLDYHMQTPKIRTYIQNQISDGLKSYLKLPFISEYVVTWRVTFFFCKSINNEQSNALHLQITSFYCQQFSQDTKIRCNFKKEKKDRSTFEIGVHCWYQGTICSWLFSFRLVRVDNNYSIKIQSTW